MTMTIIPTGMASTMTAPSGNGAPYPTLSTEQKRGVRVLAYWGRWFATEYPCWNLDTPEATRTVLDSLVSLGMVHVVGQVYLLTHLGVMYTREGSGQSADTGEPGGRIVEWNGREYVQGWRAGYSSAVPR
jgi:hypothetical protein